MVMSSTNNTERTVAAVMTIAVLATSVLEGVGCIGALLSMADKRRPPIRFEQRGSREDVLDPVETILSSLAVIIAVLLVLPNDEPHCKALQSLLRFLLVLLPNDEPHCNAL
mmetsp:Transcript_6591/g.18405  ORF Transcript_6591/g.18405 Transcript_6591/m.18405 type:complete len:111 (-) Transcript_6591:162-494(-)